MLATRQDSLAAGELAAAVGRLPGVVHNSAIAQLSHTLLFEAPTPRAIAARLLPIAHEASAPLASRELTSVASSGEGTRGASGEALCSCAARVGGGVGWGVGRQRGLWAMLQSSGDAVGCTAPRRCISVDPHLAAAAACGGSFHQHGSFHYGSFLSGAERFAAESFGIVPLEAKAMEPRQRLLLELGYTAVHAAAHRRSSLAGAALGCFVGMLDQDASPSWVGWGSGATDEARDAGKHGNGRHAAASASFALTGSTASIAAGRLPFVLGLHGPSMSVDTACSTALVTAHLASLALRTPASSPVLSPSIQSALSASASLRVDLRFSMLLSAVGFLSPVGRCKTFDCSADGYARGECVCAMLLAPFSGMASPTATASDHAVPAAAPPPPHQPPTLVQQPLGVQSASAVHHDGKSASLTAPSAPAQQRLLRAVWRLSADVDAPSLVEAHGSGTALGDPVETRALAAALCDARSAASSPHTRSSAHGHSSMALSGCKASVGHTEVAAGHCGLMRSLHQLSGQTTQANAQLRVANPLIDTRGGDGGVGGVSSGYLLALPTQAKPIRHRACGVSSFGFSGTIAHALVALPADIRGGSSTTGGGVAPPIGLRRCRLPWPLLGGCSTAAAAASSLPDLAAAGATITGAWRVDSQTAIADDSTCTLAHRPAGRVPAVALPPLSRAEVHTALCDMVVELAPSGTSVAAQSACPLEELGLDSLAVLTLRDSIESRFADIGTLDTRLVLDATIDALVGHIVQRQEAAAAAAAAQAEASAPASAAQAMGGQVESHDWFAHPDLARGFASLFQAALSPRPSRWFALPEREHRPLVMVCTSLRSGSSLLSFILNAHRDLFAPQGLFLLPYSNLRERRLDLEANLLFIAGACFTWLRSTRHSQEETSQEETSQEADDTRSSLLACSLTLAPLRPLQTGSTTPSPTSGRRICPAHASSTWSGRRVHGRCRRSTRSSSSAVLPRYSSTGARRMRARSTLSAAPRACSPTYASSTSAATPTPCSRRAARCCGERPSRAASSPPPTSLARARLSRRRSLNTSTRPTLRRIPTC